MAFVPYTGGYGYPYAGYGAGAYGPSLEEVKKIREAEEAAFKAAEDKAKELYEAEKKQYEEERELAVKLGSAPFAHGYGYPGAHGGYGAGYGGYGAYGGYGGYGAGYGAGYGYGGRGGGYGRFY